MRKRLVRLQHHRELRQIEAADIHESAGALLRRDLDGVRKRIAHFAQRHQPKRRRQVERRRGGRADVATAFKRHDGSRLLPGLAISLWNTYNLSDAPASATERGRPANIKQ